MMTPLAHRSFGAALRTAAARAPFLLLLALVAAGCGHRAADAPVAAVKPELPDALKQVAADLEQQRAAAAPATNAPESEDTATGEFQPRVEANVAPRIAGRVAAVLVDEGQTVAKGQVLLRFESEYLRLDVERAAADLARATAGTTEAQRDLIRKQELQSKGSIAQASFDRSQAAADRAKADQASSQATLDTARQRFADADLRAPIAGVVSHRQAQIGEQIDVGRVVFSLQQIAPLKLRFRLPERRLGAIESGQSVEARVDPFPGDVFAGRVTQVGGTVDPASRTFFVEAEFPNHDGRLRPGLFARIRLQR